MRERAAPRSSRPALCPAPCADATRCMHERMRSCTQPLRRSAGRLVMI